MFGLDWSEIIFVAALALVIVGPRDLPGMFRLLGQAAGRIKRFYAQATASYHRLEREVDIVDRPRSETETPSLMALLPDDLRREFEMTTPLRDANRQEERRRRMTEVLGAQGVDTPGDRSADKGVTDDAPFDAAQTPPRPDTASAPNGRADEAHHRREADADVD